MKINSSLKSNLSALKDGAPRTPADDATPAGTPSASGPRAGGLAGDANVNLSGLSSALRSLAASGEADIDVGQVEAIRQALREGTLAIDPGKIADGVLQTAHSLLKKNRSSGD